MKAEALHALERDGAANKRIPSSRGAAALFFSATVLCGAALLQGCLFFSPRNTLERLKAERGEPWATTVFAKSPGPGEQPLEALRETLEYWSAPGSAGEPRYKGVLTPEPVDLYQSILAKMDQGAGRFTLLAHEYGHRLTLVDYLDAKGERLGWDHPAFPAPKEHLASFPLVGFYNLQWWEFPQLLLLDLPVYLALGAKELAGEIVKSPLSLLEAGWIRGSVQGRCPVSPVSFEQAGGAFLEDWRNGFSALLWRLRVRSQHTPWDLAVDLVAAVPVVGPLLDHKSPPTDSSTPPETSVIVLTPGGGEEGEDEEYLTAWKRAVEEIRPESIVTVAPHRHGGGFDALWSVLNISHGTGYDLAERIVFDEGVGPGDAVEILGVSAGGQRALAASRALRCGGVTVGRLISVAGPVGGFSCAAESWVLRDEDPFEDIAVLLWRALLCPLAPFPPNVGVSLVPEAGDHGAPFFPDPATRAPAMGYARRLEDLIRHRGN